MAKAPRHMDFLTFPLVEMTLNQKGVPQLVRINKMEIPTKSVDFNVTAGDLTQVTLTFVSDKIDIQYTDN